jgi:hypothetical protein
MKIFIICCLLFIHVNMCIFILGFQVSIRVSDIRGFGFGDGFPPESVFGSGSGFDFGFRFWVHGDSTRSERDSLPSLLFIASLHVSFGLPLPLLTLISQLRTSQCTGASRDLLWTWPNHLNRCWTSFSSIGATPRRSRIVVPSSIHSCVTTNPTQHTHFRDTQLLDMSSFCRPTFCSIQHSGSNRRYIKLAFKFLWYPLVTKNARCLAPFHPPCFNPMITEGIFLRHHLTMEKKIRWSAKNEDCNVFVLLKCPQTFLCYFPKARFFGCYKTKKFPLSKQCPTSIS